MTWQTNLMMAPAFAGGFWLWVTRDQPMFPRQRARFATGMADERAHAAYYRAVACDFDERGIVDSGAPLPR